MSQKDRQIDLDGLETLAQHEGEKAEIVPDRYKDGTPIPDTMHVEVKPRGFYVPAQAAPLFLKTIAETVTTEDVQQIVRELVAGAKEGDVKKTALLLKYVVGNRDVQDLDRVFS